MTKEGKTLTGEELEQAFQEGIDYLENLGYRYHQLALEPGQEGKIIVGHVDGGLKVLIEFPGRLEVYEIDVLDGLKMVYVPATEKIHTEVLGDLSPFPCGWVEFKTDLRKLSLNFQKDKREQRLLALRLIDRLREGIE
jgi:hypothetical protein